MRVAAASEPVVWYFTLLSSSSTFSDSPQMPPPPASDSSKGKGKQLDGDSYVRALAKHIRSHERALADILSPRQQSQPDWRTLGLTQTSSKPAALLRLDPHHLYYLLLRFGEAGVPSESIGPADLDAETPPSRPVSYYSLRQSGAIKDDDAASFMSAVSSIGSSWFGTSSSALPVPADARFIYSAFTKIPALFMSSSNAPPPSHRFVAGFETLPDNKLVPLYAFKNLQLLVLKDLDPRSFVGWDALADSLRRLEISNSGVEDVSEVLIDRVVDDETRRKGEKVEAGRRDVSLLPAYKWRQLRHLSLAANDLTFLPHDPFEHHFGHLVHLDLSDNLLVATPNLSALVSLRSLCLANNMIDTVQGIYRHLGAVIRLDLSRNRIESLAGLDKLFALEKLDLSSNRLEDGGEVERLASLPHLVDLALVENPFAVVNSNWRIKAFSAFAQAGRDPAEIKLDGAVPSFNERRSIVAVKPKRIEENVWREATSSPVKQVVRSPERVVSPPPAPLAFEAQNGQPVASTSRAPSASTSRAPSPEPVKAQVKKRRKPRRIVDLDAAPVSPPAKAVSEEEDPGGTSEQEAAAFRKRIEALRTEIGPSWLSVLNEQESQR